MNNLKSIETGLEGLGVHLHLDRDDRVCPVKITVCGEYTWLAVDHVIKLRKALKKALPPDLRPQKV